MDKDTKEILLNYYFYPITNDHTIVIAGAEAIKRDIEGCLKKDVNLQDIKDRLFQMIASIEQVEARAWKAHENTSKLKEHLNKLIPVPFNS